MKNLIVFLVCLISFQAHSAEDFQCLASTLHEDNAIVPFIVKRNHTNFTGSGIEIAGKKYHFFMRLSPSMIEINVTRKDNRVFTTAMHVDSNLIKQFEFSFQDKKKEIFVICKEKRKTMVEDSN